jgi:rsbT antagonist protein RsbS
VSERVPILKIGQLLLVSIQVDLSDDMTLTLQDDLANRIVETSAHGVVIDISALQIVDTFIGRMLATIASMSHVLDAETVVVGMRPAVAITLAELGLSLGGVRTALNAEKAFAMLRESIRVAHGGEDGSDTDPPAGSERDDLDPD